MKYCEKCGSQLSDNATFCAQCGNRAEKSTINQISNEPKRSIGLGILCILGGIAIIVITIIAAIASYNGF